MSTPPKQTRYADYSWPYLKAIGFMALIGIVIIFAITWIRPEADDVIVIGSVTGFMTPSTLALLALMKSQETHLSVNSRLDAMMAASERASRAEGHEAGRLAQQHDSEQRIQDRARDQRRDEGREL